MKHFFEQYGGVALGILALLVLIAMITPVGNIIKTSLQGTANKFSSSMNGQLDDAMNATVEAQMEAQGKNPYKKQVMSVQRLYDVGESRLTRNDAIEINGIKCWVLQVDEDNKKAELITVYTYAFNAIHNYVNGVSLYENADNYENSWLKNYMDDFYANKLGSNEYIIDSEFTHLHSGTTTNDLSSYQRSTYTQKVHPLDIDETIVHNDIFVSNNSFSSGSLINKDGNRGANNEGFWVPVYKKWYSDSYIGRFGVLNTNSGNHPYLGEIYVDGLFGSGYIGARPTFWISLE